MFFKRLTLLVAAICCTTTFLVADDKDEKEEPETIKVYGMEFPAGKPDKPSKMEQFNERNGKLLELRAKVLEHFQELSTIASMDDPKKMQRKAQSELKKLDRAKKAFYKEAKKVRGKWDKDYKKLKAKKEDLEKKIERAEDKGDERSVEKYAQEIAKFGSKYESLENNINIVNYYCYFEQDELLAAALEMEIPGYGKAKDALKDDDKDKDKDKDDDNDDDDKDKKKSKRKSRKKSRRNNDD